uniref:Uncharacterized protein n=1 Tax=viral metagenome TaxID=1070528 RepID=A0A6C0D720_9ZZZZ
MNIITTMAQHVDNDEKYNEREKQYMYTMARIFSYNIPVYCVVSETHNNPEFKPKEFFQFEKLLEIHNTDINNNKSQKEFNSIKSLLANVNLDDDSWVIKISGRYLIYNDSFINTLKEQPISIKAVIKTCDDNTQMYTFLFALRFKYFKQFFSDNLPDNINLERILLLYIQHNLCDKQIKYIDSLGIFSNIADCNVFTYF